MSNLGLGLVPSDPSSPLEAHLLQVWAGACLLLHSPLLPSAAHCKWQLTLLSLLAPGIWCLGGCSSLLASLSL